MPCTAHKRFQRMTAELPPFWLGKPIHGVFVDRQVRIAVADVKELPRHFF